VPASTAATNPTQGTSQAVAPASASAKTGGTLNVALSDLGNENLDVILASTNNNVIYPSVATLKLSATYSIFTRRRSTTFASVGQRTGPRRRTRCPRYFLSRGSAEHRSPSQAMGSVSFHGFLVLL
jgi:hypothetical protein